MGNETRTALTVKSYGGYSIARVDTREAAFDRARAIARSTLLPASISDSIGVLAWVHPNGEIIADARR